MDADGEVWGLEKMKAQITEVHDQGGVVKVAFGGAMAAMINYITTDAEAKAFCKTLAKVAKDTGIDGVDFDVEAAAPLDVQESMFKHCRQELGKDAWISYTIPGTGELVQPYKTVLKDMHDYFDNVNLMAYDVYWSGYDVHKDIEEIAKLGVPMSKIVWGIMPGRHDAMSEYTTVQDAVDAGRYAKEQGMAGVMYWDVNRDTDHRTTRTGDLFMTGQPDGTYLNAIHQGFNEAKVRAPIAI